MRRSGHLTLAPPRTLTTLVPAATAIDLSVTAGDYPWLRLPDSSYIFGIGNSIYRTTDGLTFSRIATGGADAGGVGSLVEFIDRDSTVQHFAFFWSRTAALSGTARYMKSTDGGLTWANGASDKVLHHGFFWDNKLIASYGRSIIFATLTAAVENWNLDDVNDAEFIANVAADHISYVGVAPAPWGEPAVYFQNAQQLWVLDFFARKAYPIDTGIGRFIHGAIMWNGQISITDGWNLFLYDPGGQSVRNIGFYAKQGISPEMRDTDGQATIRFLLASDAYLYAAVGKPSTGNERRTYLFCYNGVGWSQLSGENTNLEPSGMFQGNYRSFGLVSNRKIHILGSTAYDNLTTKVASYQLSELHHVPVVGADSFESGGAQWITGWIDGGFNELEGALLRLFIDAFNLSTTETVKIEYQLDNAETSAWTQMVDTLNAADVFDNTTDTLYFSAASPKRGVQFRTVRFRITLNRGGNATRSPEVTAFTLVYLKKPEFRSSWQFQIDVNRMLEAAVTYTVDAATPTLANIWTKIQSLWNTQTLLQLVIPNVEPDPGINVVISDAPMTFDDFRNAVDGQGFITLQLLEPVSR